ncbi:hypothetical protein FLONG3_9883 [Fusarium longipes]|uniref:Uncharacterized protein n=1 Tax=Fusarium longipes TaxID=694270 RepID=A0A395RTG3_9HYPO|nr:hypothetical protein FLONG3_9883 [Fusarium longipes]
MYRLKPTTITITASEMTDTEHRSQYRTKLIAHQKRKRHSIVTALGKKEAALGHTMNTRAQTPDIDPTEIRQTRSSSSPDVLEREEEPTSLISLAGNSIPEETDAIRLPIRTRLADRINDTIMREEDEARTAQQLLTTVAVGRPLHWNEPILRIKLGGPTRSSQDSSTHDRSPDSLERVNSRRDADMTTLNIAEELSITPPRRNLSVYSDALPVYGQPQTPRQLPEARHQSRFKGAYTAPIRGRRTEADIDDAPITVRRRRAGRNTSLVGLSPELQGLYTDNQNTDDM